MRLESRTMVLRREDAGVNVGGCCVDGTRDRLEPCFPWKTEKLCHRVNVGVGREEGAPVSPQKAWVPRC